MSEERAIEYALTHAESAIGLGIRSSALEMADPNCTERQNSLPRATYCCRGFRLPSTGVLAPSLKSGLPWAAQLWSPTAARQAVSQAVKQRLGMTHRVSKARYGVDLNSNPPLMVLAQGVEP
jgi:hypothetical protein